MKRSLAFSCLSFCTCLFSAAAMAQTINVTPVTLNETTGESPDLVVFSGKLYLAWTGTDPQRKINIMSSTNGTTWSNKVILDGTYDAGPSLGVNEGSGRIYVSFLESSSAIGTKYSTNGTSWTTRQLIDYLGQHDDHQEAPIDYSSSTSGMVAFKNGSTSHLEYRGVYADGSQNYDSGWFTLNSNDTTSYNPDYRTNYSSAWLKAWTGTDPNHTINTILVDGAHGFDGSTAYTVSGAYSNDGPSVAFNPSGSSTPNRIVIGWVGRDPGKTLNLYLNNYSSASIRQLNQWSNSGPAVECFDGKIWIAWRGGTDNKVNIASVSFWN